MAVAVSRYRLHRRQLRAVVLRLEARLRRARLRVPVHDCASWRSARERIPGRADHRDAAGRHSVRADWLERDAASLEALNGFGLRCLDQLTIDVQRLRPN